MIDKGFSAIVFDCTTLLRWNRPVVGIVRTQLEVARYLLDSKYKIKFVAFKDNKAEILPIPKEYIAEKIQTLSHIQSNMGKDKIEYLKDSTRYFADILDRLRIMNKMVEDILQKISFQQNLKSYNEMIVGELSPLALPMITKKTRALFDKESLFISMGLDWDHSNYALLYRLKQEIGFKFVGILYDVILLRNPEWAVSQELAKRFAHHFYYLAHICDSLVSISESAKKEFLALIEEYQIQSCPCIKVIYLGDSVCGKKEEETRDVLDSKGDLLPVPITPTMVLTEDPKTGELVYAEEDSKEPQQEPLLLARFSKRPHKKDYVMYVSTLEPRKNHLLLLEVWEILQQRHATNIPDLVLVGMKGWGVERFFEAYDNKHALKKNIHWYADVGDEELGFLYQHCLFTLFPSFAEGWGLGVVESLCYAKPVILSKAPALSEAAQNLMPTLDATAPAQWADLIMQWYENPNILRALSEEIGLKYKRHRWEDFSTEMIEFALLKGEKA